MNKGVLMENLLTAAGEIYVQIIPVKPSKANNSKGSEKKLMTASSEGEPQQVDIFAASGVVNSSAPGAPTASPGAGTTLLDGATAGYVAFKITFAVY